MGDCRIGRLWDNARPGEQNSTHRCAVACAGNPAEEVVLGGAVPERIEAMPAVPRQSAEGEQLSRQLKELPTRHGAPPDGSPS